MKSRDTWSTVREGGAREVQYTGFNYKGWIYVALRTGIKNQKVFESVYRVTQEVSVSLIVFSILLRFQSAHTTI